MTKKRIRQMNGALRRRLTSRPAADWLPDGESFARTLEAENYMQRFAPLFHGVRLRCAEQRLLLGAQGLEPALHVHIVHGQLPVGPGIDQDTVLSAGVHLDEGVSGALAG